MGVGEALEANVIKSAVDWAEMLRRRSLCGEDTERLVKSVLNDL